MRRSKWIPAILAFTRAAQPVTHKIVSTLRQLPSSLSVQVGGGLTVPGCVGRVQQCETREYDEQPSEHPVRCSPESILQ